WRRAVFTFGVSAPQPAILKVLDDNSIQSSTTTNTSGAPAYNVFHIRRVLGSRLRAIPSRPGSLLVGIRVGGLVDVDHEASAARRVDADVKVGDTAPESLHHVVE